MSTALRYKTFLLIGTSLLFFSMNIYGQEDPTLQQYIDEGLKNNSVIQERNISLEKALLSLKTAKNLFLPVVGLQGAYQNGEGGRNISIPIGDLLNPVYSTLNQLTASQSFPQVENVKQNFFPNNFYDVKVRASMPIINTDLIYNKKLQAGYVTLQQLELDIYKRELVRDIKIAYFNYISAIRAVSIYENALEVAKEGKRINQRLLENGKGLPAYLLRSDAETEAIEAKYNEAKRQVMNAGLYFNFLINTKPDDAIDTSFDPAKGIAEVMLRVKSVPVLQTREEILQLEQVKTLQEMQLNLNKSYVVPKLSGFADIGLQAEKMKFNSSDADYYLVGMQLDVPLFAGFTNRHKIRQSKLDLHLSTLQITDVQNRLSMSASISFNELNNAWNQYQSALRQEQSATAYYRLIDKGYKEGVNTFLEMLDARNQLTNTGLQVNLAQMNVMISLARVEREEGTYSIKNSKN